MGRHVGDFGNFEFLSLERWKCEGDMISEHPNNAGLRNDFKK